MYSKQVQLQKTKKDNPKKMPKALYQKKCDWLFEKYPKCQVCLINNSEDAHHAKYGNGGADKDDRSIIALCRECHRMIHHSRTGIVEKHGYEAMRHRLEILGYANHDEWEEYNEQGFTY